MKRLKAALDEVEAAQVALRHSIRESRRLAETSEALIQKNRRGAEAMARAEAPVIREA